MLAVCRRLLNDLKLQNELSLDTTNVGGVLVSTVASRAEGPGFELDG